MPWFLGILFASFVFWMPIAFFFLGVSPTNQFEESVGYRYFYSLRNVFGGEFPWIPQGQLPNLFHRVIQRVLDWLGYAHTDLHGRVDSFSFLAVLVPLLLSGCLAGLVFRQSKVHPLAISGIFAAALILLLPPTPNGWTVLPDYHVWLVPLALTAMLLLARAQTLPITSLAVGVAALAAAAVATKLSFLVFAFPVSAGLFARMRESGLVLRALLTAMTAFILLLAVILTLYFPDFQTFAEWISGTLRFIRTQRTTLPIDLTFWQAFLSEPYLLLVVTTQVGLALFGVVRRRIEAVALAVGGVSLVAFLTQRLYSHSFIELHAYLFLETGTLVLWAAASPWLQGRRPALALAAVAAASALTLALAWHAVWVQPISLLSYSRTLVTLSTAFETRLHAQSRDVWILTTGNAYRPNSIHSALCKGGTEMFSPYWGESRYLSGLFSNFHCAVVPDGVTQEHLVASTIGFLRYPDEAIPSALDRVESYFSLSLTGRQCVDISSNAFGYVVCDPPQSAP